MNRILVNLLLSILLLTYSPILLGQGTEKISNGTIDNSTDWTLIGSGFSINNGVATFNGTTPSYLRQASSDMLSVIEDSKRYLISFDITTVSENDYAWIRIYGSSHIPLYKAFDKYYEGSHKVILSTPASGNDGGIEFYATSGGDAFDIDNISVIELPALTGGPYFVATEAEGGNDINDGSIGSPWVSWQRAVNAALPGDTVYFRGGTYYKQPYEDWIISEMAGYGVNGERGNPISYMGYPPDIAAGDSIIFDCSQMYIPQPDTDGIEATPPTANPLSVTGISCTSDFIVFKGFTLRNIYQKRRYIQATGFNLSWANNIRVENCVLYNCSGHGFYYDPWWSPDGQDSTIFLNNDAYNCCDSFAINVYNYRDAYGAPTAGTWGNGFMIITVNKPNEDTNAYVQFIGNRAWNNADEGVNLSSCGTTYAHGNWSFANGYHLVHGVYDHETSGNGWKVNGGYYDQLDTNDVQYYFYNNIGAFNIGYGYGENSNGRVQRNREIYNNTMYRNYYGYQVLNPHGAVVEGLHTNRYVNNIAYDNRQFELTASAQNYMYENRYNSWNDPPDVTVTDADFALTDSVAAIAQMKAPRNADGSLPEITFLTLAIDSDLIDAGTDIGIPFCNVAPDLGYHEFEVINSCFEMADTAYTNSHVDVIYTGNATTSADYYWDFNGATVISGSGQGPYTLQWTSIGDKAVSLYVEESGFTTDTTTNDIYIEDLTSSFQLPDTANTNSSVNVIYTGNASASATYYWDFGSATVISGSGQGPYVLQWSTAGCYVVSLYVEESNIGSETTTNEICIISSFILSSEFQINPDTVCPKGPVNIIYTGNASASATYYWDFGYATILSGSGQGPYTVQWPYGGFAAVSLYVEENGLASDTTTNDLLVLFDPNFTIVPSPNDTVSVNDTIILTGDIESVSYLWSTGETTQSIQVFYSPPEMGGGYQNYWLTVTDENGCSSSDTITVWFDDMPVQIIDLPDEIDLKVYPNPVSDVLNVELKIVEHGQYVFEVIDHLGRPVSREYKSFETGAQKMHLSTSSLSPGVYILTVKSNKGMIGVKKIIK